VRPGFPADSARHAAVFATGDGVVAVLRGVPWQALIVPPCFSLRRLLRRAVALEYRDCVFGKARVMEKWMCYGALGVAGLMFLLFLLDLVIGIPFGGSVFLMADIFGLLASVAVGYLGFNALRDLR